MAKYSTIILLVAVAVHWTSTSARPTEIERKDLLEAIDREAINKLHRQTMEAAQGLREPYRTRVTNKLQELKSQHWDSFEEYATVLSFYVHAVVNFPTDENSRRRRAVYSVSKESFEDDSYEILDLKELYQWYANDLIKVAPSAYKSTLKQKYEKAVEKNYENFLDFANQAEAIFKEVTGQDSDSVEEDQEN